MQFQLSLQHLNGKSEEKTRNHILNDGKRLSLMTVNSLIQDNSADLLFDYFIGAALMLMFAPRYTVSASCLTGAPFGNLILAREFMAMWVHFPMLRLGPDFPLLLL